MQPDQQDAHLTFDQWSEVALDRLRFFAGSTHLAEHELGRLSPATLAYLGDAVYEIFVRTYYLMPPKRLKTYHKQVVDQVRAESQVHWLHTLAPHLTPSELDVIRRGRNSTGKGPRRIESGIYQQASGFETLIGYLYLTDPQRLTELLLKLTAEFERGDQVSIQT